MRQRQQRIITEQGLVALHDVVRQQFPLGITRGKINEGKIKAIVERPYMELYGCAVYSTIYEKAACYLEGIVRLHPFPDGNKRTAMLAASSFLQTNNHYLVLPLDTVKFLVSVAEEQGGTEEEIRTLIERIAAWLELRTAHDMATFAEKINEYIISPISSVIERGEDHTKRAFDDWFVIESHPEYAENVTDVIQFLMRTYSDIIESISKMSYHK